VVVLFKAASSSALLSLASAYEVRYGLESIFAVELCFCALAPGDLPLKKIDHYSARHFGPANTLPRPN
jgi:hypothetical protein